MLEFQDAMIRQGSFALAADVILPGGAITALMGPSGAGKSTLLNAIAGFLPLAEGRLLWEGRDLGPLAPGKRPVAMLFQDNNLFPHLTAARNVALGRTQARRLSPEISAEVTAALEAVGLAGLGARKPAALSGGQQSRVALARVLVQDRPLLLLDEPFAALGPALKAEMLDRVAALAAERDLTVLMVSHDPEDARRIAQNIAVVAEGRVSAPAPTGPLLEAPPPALKAYLG